MKALHPPPLPHEHGAWAMLLIPLLLGLAASWPPAGAALLLVPAMTLLFFSRYAALPAALRLAAGKTPPPGFVERRALWTAIYLGGGLVCAAGAFRLAAPAARPATLAAAVATLALGGLHTGLVFAGRDRTLWGEMIGMAGLASAAPLVQAASGQPLDREAYGVGLLALAYFVSSLAFVRAYRDTQKGRRGAARRCIVAHLILAAVMIALWRPGFVGAGALAALIPPFLRTAWGLLAPPASLLALGWREVAVATLFGALAAVALLLGPA